MEIKSKYETLPLYIDFPEKKIDIFTPCDANYVVTCGGRVSYMPQWQDLKLVDIFNDYSYGWVISFCRRYVIIDRGRIIYQNPNFYEEYKQAMEYSYHFDSYDVFFDRPYTYKYIDMVGNECIAHPHANHYRDQSLEEVLQNSIQFSIDNDCKVVIMKTMECYDRH